MRESPNRVLKTIPFISEGPSHSYWYWTRRLGGLAKTVNAFVFGAMVVLKVV